MSIIKVDRVRSVQEALALEAAGVTIIGVNLGLDPRCPERGYVSPEVGEEIGRALRTAKFCVMLDPEAEDLELAIEAASALGPYYFQVSHFSQAQGGYWKDSFEEAGLPVIFDVYDASYETEEGWVSYRLDDALSWGASLIQLDLLDDITNPWRFLQEESPKYPDELLQMREIVSLTEKYPLVITMDVWPDEAFAFRSAFPAAAGVFFRLPPGDISPVIDVVAALQRPARPDETAASWRGEVRYMEKDKIIEVPGLKVRMSPRDED